MITEEILITTIHNLGYVSAYPKLCVPKINEAINEGKIDLDFYINSMNSCWFIGKHPSRFFLNTDRIFTLNVKQIIRDKKLKELGINV